MAKVPKIVWAVDAFHDAPKTQLKGAKVVEQFFPGNKVIQPVAMLRSGQYDAESTMFLDKWKDLAGTAETNLSRMLIGSSLKRVNTPRLLKTSGGSTSDAVRDLIRFALDEKADMIVVTSHARKGSVRAVLGSFAETLVLLSPIPVVVISPVAKLGTKIKTILFPTDLSDKSKAVFERILPLAQSLSAQIILMHKVSFTIPTLYPFVVPKVLKESVDLVVRALEGQAQDWIDTAEANGVKVTLHIDARGGRPLDEVLKVAKKLEPSGMIAMASQSGVVSSAILGSLTRQVLRSATCPVLVIHPDERTIAREFLNELKDIGYAYAANPAIR